MAMNCMNVMKDFTVDLVQMVLRSFKLNVQLDTIVQQVHGTKFHVRLELLDHPSVGSTLMFVKSVHMGITALDMETLDLKGTYQNAKLVFIVPKVAPDVLHSLVHVDIIVRLIMKNRILCHVLVLKLKPMVVFIKTVLVLLSVKPVPMVIIALILGRFSK